MARFSSLAAGLLIVASLSSAAGAVSTAADQPPPVAIGSESVTFQPPANAGERIAGLRIVITQVNYPGVPERSACRFLVRATNDGSQKISSHALFTTFDSNKVSLNSWLIPTGELAPGQSVDRIYSCKRAQTMLLDQNNASGWPNRCTVDGIVQTPCPVVLRLDSNLTITNDQPALAEVQAKH